MLKITLGEMLKRFRIEKGVEARQICEGLCSQGMMSLYEKGKNVPDSLLFECMMERMGVSPELFSMMVSREEYEYYEWKAEVSQAIGERDTIKLEKLLSTKIPTQIYCNKKLEKQFLLYAQAILHGFNEQYEKAAGLLEEAMCQTISDIKKVQKTKTLLSVIELHILMLYLYYGILGERLQIDEGKKMFDVLDTYINSETLDLIIRAKMYPKLCCIGFVLFEQVLSEQERIALCENSVALMKKDLSFHEITNVLRFYIPLLERTGSSELNFYKKQYEVFEDILRIANIKTKFYVENLVAKSPKVYLINEYLLSERQSNNLTQEKLSEGICEPETYSRVETGKRAPSKQNLSNLTERLHINWCYYRGELDSANAKVFELRIKQRIESIKGHDSASLDILCEMEKYLDMSSEINMQYINANKYMLEWHLKQRTLQDTYNRLIELFNITFKEKTDMLGLAYYSQNELEIMGCIAKMHRYNGESQKGIEFLEKILKQMQNSQVRIKSQWNGFSFIIHILSGLYFQTGLYDKSLECIKYVLLENIKRREADGLPEVLDSVADCLEHIDERYNEEYRKLYRYTYYVSDFFKIDKVLGFAKKFYQDKFDAEIVWY